MLSGGLGSSTYVRDQLQQHFATRQHPSAQRVDVIRCNDPQLVVVRGLLLDRQQRYQTGGMASVLAARVARASYGVIVKHAYVPEQHVYEDIAHDEHEPNKMWAINQIQWLIKKGDLIAPNSSVTKEFNVRLAAGELTRTWGTKIVMSNNETNALPRSLKQGACV